MRALAPLSLIALLALTPAKAEETSEGLSLMEEGARTFLRGLMAQTEPAMEELQRLIEGMEPAMRQFMTEMGPALSELLSRVDDLSSYHPPEMLPNGDILLRRRAPAPESPQPESPQPDNPQPPLPEGAIEL